MSVYATADGPLIVTSDRSTGNKLKTAISRFVGGVGALAGASLLVQFALERYISAPQDDAVAEPMAEPEDSDDAGIAVDEPADDEPPETADEPDYERDEVVEDEPDIDPEADADPTYADDPGIADSAPDAAEAIFATIPPGALFFLGGFVVLVGVTAYWYWSTTY